MVDDPMTPETAAAKFSRSRKYVILFIVSWMTLAATWSASSIFIATPEISVEFQTTSDILTILNAGVLICMGVSPLLWSPIGLLCGRRNSYNAAILIFAAASIGTALAPNLGVFTTMRLLGGTTGTYFLVAGQTILADIFEPVKRGKAVGFFMTGSVAGPALGPCISGVIVTFTHWRYIFWLQVAMVCLGLVLSIFFVPEIQSTLGAQQETRPKSLREIALVFDPRGVFAQLLVPRILLAHLTCGLLATTQYGLLAAIRHIINPRFNLSTPLVSGLFYIAPGLGFFTGSIVGGRLSDRTVRHYIVKRGGVRIPEDRLHSGLVGLFGVLPAAALIFGWTLEKEVGGLAVPIISAFWIGIGLMGTFNSLNTYAAEASPERRSEVLSAKYVIQWAFGAASTAAVIPFIDATGPGLVFTVFSLLDILGGCAVIYVIKSLRKKV
ncbi:putative Major facilitator superfamily (MFS) profile domain-containing protein [Seiridium cardinale]|uniref:Major facilitator superfamily (MFS) profile domain-containing protein n=1 Tax=Seiridium cardinale TaxID=138064 RepID=A0ABR2X8R4_9PEZI